MSAARTRLCIHLAVSLFFVAMRVAQKMPNVGIEGAHSTRVIDTCFQSVRCLSWYKYYFFFSQILTTSKVSLSFKGKTKGELVSE